MASPKSKSGKGKKVVQEKITLITPVPKVPQLHLTIQHSKLRHPAQHLSVPMDQCQVEILRKLICEKVGFTTQELDIWLKFNVTGENLVPLADREEFKRLAPGRECWPGLALLPDGAPEKVAWNVFNWIRELKMQALSDDPNAKKSTEVLSQQQQPSPAAAQPPAAMSAMEALTRLQRQQVADYNESIKSTAIDPTIALPKMLIPDLECNVVYEMKPDETSSEIRLDFDESDPRALFLNSGNSHRGFFIESL